MTVNTLADLHESFYIPLTHYGLISVTGEEKANFLHGQLTMDVNKLETARARRFAHCDFKGKAWATGIIAHTDDTLMLLEKASALPASLEQLKKYGVFSKIVIDDNSEKQHQYYLQGPLGEAFIERYFTELPEHTLSIISQNGSKVIKLDYPDNGYWLIADEAGSKALSAFTLQNKVTQYPSTIFEAIQIANGIPEVDGKSVNQFVPQMMNLQALDALDFNKGCYMGQEVVARTRYLGKNKRAAFVLRSEAGIQVENGAMVEKQLGENWRSGGTVLRSASLQNETWLLAIMPNDTVPDTAVRLSEDCPNPLIIQPLSYTLE